MALGPLCLDPAGMGSATLIWLEALYFALFFPRATSEGFLFSTSSAGSELRLPAGCRGVAVALLSKRKARKTARKSMFSVRAYGPAHARAKGPWHGLAQASQTKQGEAKLAGTKARVMHTYFHLMPAVQKEKSKAMLRKAKRATPSKAKPRNL